MESFDDSPHTPSEGKSKSQIKREMKALQQLGERLVLLPAEVLGRMPLEDPLREAVIEARRLRRGEALRRQLQFVGRLMRNSDAQAIRAALDREESQALLDLRRARSAEHWRSRLLEEGDRALAELLVAHPQADRRYLRQLLRNANRERAEERPPHAARKLFRYLRDLDGD